MVSAFPSSVATPGQLAAFLRSQKEAVVARWVGRVRTDPNVPSADGLAEPALRDHVPALLDRLVQALEKAAGLEVVDVETVAGQIGVAREAREHAKERVVEGYSAPESLRELAHLRLAILDACESAGLEPDARASRAIHAAIDEVSATSMSEMARVARKAHAALAENERRLAFLAEASAAIGGSLARDEIVAHLARVVVRRLADWCSVYAREPDGTVRLIAAEDIDPSRRGELHALQGGFASGSEEARGAARVLLTGKAELVEGIDDARGMNPAMRAALASLGVRSWVIVPLAVRGHVMGAMELGSRSASRVYSRSTLTIVEELARRAGAALENVALYEEAQAASRLKDEFLAVVSHELRTPLAAITGWAAMLRSGDCDAALLEKGLEVIDRNARAQAKLIEDILDVSRIVTGKLRVEPEPVNIAELVADALEVVRPSADAKEIALGYEAPSEPALLVGDPERLRQVFWNLLANAVKFTPHGGRVDALVRREDGAIAIAVRDTGAGIAPDFLPYVFDRFRQADTTTSRGQRGLGLGLAIVRHLVEMHGGAVAVESAGEGLGSTFTVTLPLRAIALVSAEEDRHSVHPVPSEVATPPTLHGVRVLVVDDERDVRELLAVVFGSFGADVRIVASALEAIAAARELEPDVIVSDVGMPLRDGYWLLDELKRVCPRVPVLGVSAYASAADVQKARASGFAAYLTKPVDPLSLARAVQTAHERRVSQQSLFALALR